MEFFKKPKKPEGELNATDRHVDFAMLEKEPSYEDYAGVLNDHAFIEKFSNEPNLSKKPEDGNDLIWSKIQNLSKQLGELEYDHSNEDPILRNKIISLQQRLERLSVALENTSDLEKRENIYSQILGTGQSLSRIVEKKSNNSEELLQKIQQLTNLLISIETIPTSDPHLN